MCPPYNADADLHPSPDRAARRAHARVPRVERLQTEAVKRQDIAARLALLDPVETVARADHPRLRRRRCCDALPARDRGCGAAGCRRWLRRRNAPVLLDAVA